jgi:hypothetical protein
MTLTAGRQVTLENVKWPLRNLHNCKIVQHHLQGALVCQGGVNHL